MRMHVKKTVSCCFAALRQLRQIRRSVPTSTFHKLVVAQLVHSRLDYGNGVLVGIPAHLMRRLQSVPNAAERLIINLKRPDHITDALVSLVCFFTLEIFFCKAASNVGPYGLFWQPALVCHSVILYYICLCLLGK